MNYQEWRHAHAFRIPQKALEDLDVLMNSAELVKPAPFKPLGTVYRWTALKDGKLVYQYGEDGYPQLFAKTAVKLPEEPEPAQEPLTDSEIEDCMKKAYATLGKSRNLEHVFARTIEAAHGIGGKK